MRRVLILIIVFLFVTSAHAVTDGDGPKMDAEAVEAATHAILPDGLSTAEKELFLQAFAYGYYAALHPEDTINKYVLNTNTNKFHYPSCQSAASISPENREVRFGSRDEIIADGYKPCGNCKP